jgi:2-oxoglutarate ferredoxin oxidoreductase subunit gamma
MVRKEILISGFGGQGVVLAGRILGYAAVLEGFKAAMLISHGTETRGGYVRSQVVISDEIIDSPIVENPDIFCALSQSAYDRYSSLTGPSGIVLYDPDFVSPVDHPARQFAIPAQALANEKFGKPLFANSIMLGVMFRHLILIPREQSRSAVGALVPRDKDTNVEALEMGWAQESGVMIF